MMKVYLCFIKEEDGTRFNVQILSSHEETVNWVLEGLDHEHRSYEMFDLDEIVG